MPIRKLNGSLIAVAFAAGCASLALAESAIWLSDAQIENTLKGKTLDGVYAGGRRFSESYFEGGRLEYRENGLSLHGRWSVREGTLCTIYDTDPTGGCFRITPVGGNCYEFYFVARKEEEAPGAADAKPHWTARGSVEGTPDACPEGADV